MELEAFNARNFLTPIPFPILSQVSTVHASPFHLLKINFNIILQPMLGQMKIHAKCEPHALTTSTEHSPSWTANRYSDRQEIPRILRNPKVHCRIHKRPIPLPILSQVNTVHASPFHLLKIHFNNILQFTSMSSKWSLSLRFPPPKPCMHICSPHTCHMHRLSHSSWSDHPINLLAPELFFLILAHSVYKMWIIQEPNTLELWNKLHFEEEKTESIYHV